MEHVELEIEDGLVDGTLPDLEQLVRDHWEPVYRVVLALVRDHGLAEDVTQETLLKAWKALPRFRGDSSLRTWILRIAHNTAISALRKRLPQPQDPFEMPDLAATSYGAADTAQTAIGSALMDQFEAALASLPAKTRTIVVLRELEGHPYEEIARIVGLPTTTVRTRLFRARKHLAKAMAGWDG